MSRRRGGARGGDGKGRREAAKMGVSERRDVRSRNMPPESFVFQPDFRGTQLFWELCGSPGGSEFQLTLMLAYLSYR